MVKNNVPLKKILLLGLGNSGKTSIVLSLMGNTSLPKFLELQPTKGANSVNFEAFNSDFNIWDLGGQELYRHEYLNNFQKYAEGANKIIYVIDIQDTEKYDLSLDYFEKIMNLLKDNKEISISVFLHKADPDYELDGEFVKDLIKKIKDRIPEDLSVEIFKTTIHTVFEKKIVD